MKTHGYKQCTVLQNYKAKELWQFGFIQSKAVHDEHHIPSQ
jgi:hypothetical protein